MKVNHDILWAILAAIFSSSSLHCLQRHFHVISKKLKG